MTQQAQTQALAPVGEKFIEYQAFGSNEQVKLSMEIVRKWLVKPTRSGKSASDSDTMKFMMLCRARQLNPWEGDAFLVGYDGKNGPEFSLITAHQAFLKRAEAHPQYDGMPSGVIVADKGGVLSDLEGDFVPKGYTLVGGWATVYRKDRAHPTRARLNVEIFDKGRAQWNDNKPGMIVKCAEADALRRAFPNTLGGMYNDAEVGLIQSNGNGGNGHSAVPSAPEKPVITEEQRMELVKLAKDSGVAALGEIVGNYGFAMLADITTDRFEDVKQAIQDAGTPPSDEPAIMGEVVNAPEPEPETSSAPPADLDPEEENLREYCKEMFAGLTKTQQRDFLAGKVLISKADKATLETYKNELEDLTARE